LIHPTRPAACRDFYCGWRMLDIFSDAWRPDLSGVFAQLESEDIPAQFAMRTGINLMLVGPHPAKTLRQSWFLDFVRTGIAENIRFIERTQKSERGEADPIRSLDHMTTIIAQNYCRDLRRRDCRLVSLQPDNYVWDVLDHTGEQPLTFDAICEAIDQELLLAQIVREIANFPMKQRTAILIDLANRMYFDSELTPLQKAFQEAGIPIEMYRQPLPDNIRERNQHTSLLNHAYRRIVQLPCVQTYIAETLQAVSLNKAECKAQKN